MKEHDYFLKITKLGRQKVHQYQSTGMPPVSELIGPFDIDVSAHFFDSFGSMETEISARWIVQLCQHLSPCLDGTDAPLGGWPTFTDEKIEYFYNQRGFYNFRFNGLVEKGFITKDQHTGEYRVTDEFVSRCHNAAPVGR